MTAILGSAAFVAGLAFGWPVPYALACLAVVAVVVRPLRWILLVIVVACAAVGDLRGSAVVDVAGPPAEVGWYEGNITTYANRNGPRQRQSIVVEATNGSKLCVRTTLDLTLGRGDSIIVTGDLRFLESHAPSRRAALGQIGCVATVEDGSVRVLRQGDGFRRRLDDRRQSLSEWFRRTIPGDRGVLLSGLSIGDDNSLQPATLDRLYNLGMSHITAVSGSNLALLTWLLIGRGTRRRLLAVDLTTLGVLWLYVFLAGAGPSTVRAGLTATLCVLVARTGRRPDLLSIACLVAAGQLAVDPSLIDNLAYRLSTIAMLVMISTLTGRPGGGWLSKVKLLLACSVAIQVGTLAFTPRADQAVLAGVVTNVLAAPLVGLTFLLAMTSALLHQVSDPAASAVATVAELPAQLILGLMGWMDGSWLADQNPDVLGWLPLVIVRGVLLAGVVAVFGRHARRGTADVWAGAAGLELGERWVAAGAGAGTAAGVVAVLLLR